MYARTKKTAKTRKMVVAILLGDFLVGSGDIQVPILVPLEGTDHNGITLHCSHVMALV